MKFDEKGAFEKRKCRLTACGYIQLEGIDLFETSFPVISQDEWLESIKKELNTLIELGAFKLVKRFQVEKKPLKTRWVFKAKYENVIFIKR